MMLSELALRARVASDAHTYVWRRDGGSSVGSDSRGGNLLKPMGLTKQRDVNHWGGNRSMSVTLITCVIVAVAVAAAAA